jgi:predicted metal-dependent HD superfamily phosphohydrolase
MITPLQSQWLSLCSQIQLDGATHWPKIQSAYTTPNLAYHNLHHIADCLTKFATRRQEATNPIAVELAIWFHDIIYDPRASDNEEQSAQVAASFLSTSSLAKAVSDLIIATKHSDTPSSPDTQLLCDIDLSILGSPPGSYQKYAAAIRNEYSWVSNPDYTKGRTKVLQNFLTRPTIFSLETSRTLYETQARQNIEAEINSLSS